jgi:hypothetical protein
MIAAAVMMRPVESVQPRAALTFTGTPLKAAVPDSTVHVGGGENAHFRVRVDSYDRLGDRRRRTRLRLHHKRI